MAERASWRLSNEGRLAICTALASGLGPDAVRPFYDESWDARTRRYGAATASIAALLMRQTIAVAGEGSTDVDALSRRRQVALGTLMAGTFMDLTWSQRRLVTRIFPRMLAHLNDGDEVLAARSLSDSDWPRALHLSFAWIRMGIGALETAQVWDKERFTNEWMARTSTTLDEAGRW